MADGGMASSGGDMIVGILSIRGDGPDRCCTGDDHTYLFMRLLELNAVISYCNGPI
jgi:hypothetical protein